MRFSSRLASERYYHGKNKTIWKYAPASDTERINAEIIYEKTTGKTI